MIAKKIKNLYKRIYHQYYSKSIFYSKFINNNDLVFDIGANIGNRTEVFLGIGARVIAVEPNPKIALSLTKKYPKAEIVQKAIGSNKGIVNLFLNEADVLSTTSEEWLNTIKETNRFGELAHKFNETVEVQQETINDLITKYGIPKFIKIDTEGTELEIIEQLKTNEVDCISFEFHAFKTESTDRKSRLSLKHLHSVGYKKFNISFGETMVFCGEENFDYDVLINLLDALPLTWGDIYAFRN